MSEIVVVVSVDWEGRSLLPENLELMAAFRRKHPDVPMQHFLNAAYYTRGADAARTTDAIRRTLLPVDEHGLHIHAWHSLLAAAGVSPRPELSDPKERRLDPLVQEDWSFYPPEAGYDSPLEDFDQDEIDRLIRTSIEILISHGFDRPVSFRAGAWMAGPKVHAALARNGFHLDCSAVDPRLPERRFGKIDLCRRISELWPDITEITQPYRIEAVTPELWEVPNNAGLVDYTTTDELLQMFRRNVERWREVPGRCRIVSTGFHQETARRFLRRLDSAVDAIKAIAAEERLPLVFTARPR